jgi:hypothetical protein
MSKRVKFIIAFFVTAVIAFVFVVVGANFTLVRSRYAQVRCIDCFRIGNYLRDTGQPTQRGDFIAGETFEEMLPNAIYAFPGMCYPCVRKLLETMFSFQESPPEWDV